jgi:hypothetical protein
VGIRVACMSLGCARYTEGTAVADHELPHDVRQLVERAVAAVPLTVQKMGGLLGAPTEESPQTPKRFNGGPVRLGSSLQMHASSLGIGDDGTWMFAGFGIEPDPCIPIDMIRAHYPSVELTYGVTGHSVEGVAANLRVRRVLWVVSGPGGYGGPGQR